MSRQALRRLADIVMENLDGDNEYYAQDTLSEHVIDELLQGGYLIHCDTCEEEHGWANVYYYSDGDCGNRHGDNCEDHEYCSGCEQCKDCYGCSCSRKDRQAEEAWA